MYKFNFHSYFTAHVSNMLPDTIGYTWKAPLSFAKIITNIYSAYYVYDQHITLNVIFFVYFRWLKRK